MSAPDPLAQEKKTQEPELIIKRQIAFASEIFQAEVTIRTLLESLAEAVVILLHVAAMKKLPGKSRHRIELVVS